MGKPLAPVVVLVLMPLALASPGAPPMGRCAVILRDAAAAGLVPALGPAISRTAHRRAWAINAFVTTGNRMFANRPVAARLQGC